VIENHLRFVKDRHVACKRLVNTNFVYMSTVLNDQCIARIVTIDVSRVQSASD